MRPLLALADEASNFESVFTLIFSLRTGRHVPVGAIIDIQVYSWALHIHNKVISVDAHCAHPQQLAFLV